MQRKVSKCIFYMMFGIWVEDQEADVLAGWRKLAGQFILTRMTTPGAGDLGAETAEDEGFPTSMPEALQRRGARREYYALR